MNKLRGLWRGKTTPKENGEFNGVWVEGDLIHSEGRYYIHPVANAVKTQGELGRLIIIHEVDPATLGDCTGLRDKNKKLIFEGDIIKGSNKRTFTVEYCAEICAFVARAADGVMVTPGMNTGTMEHYEVIGNIHGNPELLQKGAAE